MSKTDQGQLPRYQPVTINHRTNNDEIKELIRTIELEINRRLEAIHNRISALEGVSLSVNFDTSTHSQLDIEILRGTVRNILTS